MISGKGVVALLAMLAALPAAAAFDPGPPAAELAKRIAVIAGPGPATVVVRNSSSLAPEEAAQIRKLLERDLRGLGVVSQAGSRQSAISPPGASEPGSESGTVIRVTLSANAAGGLWVAEVREGTELHVAMLAVPLDMPDSTASATGVALSKTLLWRQKEQVLDLLTLSSGAKRRMIVLEPERMVVYTAAGAESELSSWKAEGESAIAHGRPFPRDMRGRIYPGAAVGSEHLFEAYLPGVHCHGDEGDQGLTMACEDSDDPWPLPEASPLRASGEPDAPAPAPGLVRRAFYNSARNYFTGVLSPAFESRLARFYDAAALRRGNRTAIVLSAVDGKFVAIENGATRHLAGTRDWGSDLAAVDSECGSGAQLLVSASGAAAEDSVRAYEISGLNATASSAPLEMPGAVTAMRTSGDARFSTTVVRKAGGVAPAEYEVYSVSAHCN